MKTYLVLFFNSDGKRPAEVMDKAKELGFDVIVGAHDLVYEWDKEPTEDQILSLGDKVRDKLKGCNVFFKLETV